MKKVLITAILMAGFLNTEAKVTINKQNWGLFHTWYDWIEQTNYNNGDVVVDCKNPGFTKCKVMPLNITFSGNPTPLTEANFDTIMAYSEAAVTESNTHGSFMFGAEYFVTYQYDTTTGNLKTTIYSLQEAHDAGLI